MKRNRKRDRKKVALLVEVSNTYARGLLAGIVAYQQGHTDWSVYLPEHRRGGEISIQRLEDWKVDGVLARIENESIAEVIRQLDVPTVDLSAARLVENIPWVETDNAAIAKMAAEHLVEKGFLNYGFLGESGFNWSKWRGFEFQKHLQGKNLDCQFHEFSLASEASRTWNSEIKKLRKWVLGLPKPVGIFASYDIAGHRLLEVCREEEVAVPEQVAVIGVDNDQLICNICEPTLTSIETSPFESGFFAAEVLEKWMRGDEVSRDATFFGPVAIQERLSTDTVAVNDPIVAKALWFIRENTVDVSVADVIQHVDVSRRQLEIRFKKIVGHSPHKEIQLRRLKKVKHLLATTDLSVAKIADLAGYRHSEYLSVVFQREVGVSMSQFRQQRKSRQH